MFSNWKQAYYLETCIQITIILNTYIIIEIDNMFLYLELRILSGTCLPISLLLNTYIIMEVE